MSSSFTALQLFTAANEYSNLFLGSSIYVLKGKGDSSGRFLEYPIDCYDFNIKNLSFVPRNVRCRLLRSE